MIKRIIIMSIMGIFAAINLSIEAKAEANVNLDFANNNWMSSIDGNKYLSQISIPGTHDTAALYEPIAGTAKCQDLNISKQLNIGVRYLDIRCRQINDSFAIHHGSVYQHLNFDDVVRSCNEFLRSNPSETIIMSVKEEYNPSNNTRTFEEVFDSYVDKNSSLWLLSDKIPTLAEARGKIVLLRRFYSSSASSKGINAYDWKDNAQFIINNSASLVIQDCYKVNDNGTKWTSIIEMYNSAKSNNNNTLYLNYTSGYASILGIPNINRVKNYINPKLSSYFSENTKGRFGVTVMDFVNEEISEKIISTNF